MLNTHALSTYRIQAQTKTGGHVSVPCTSYVICCYAAEIFGVVATLYVATLQRSLEQLMLHGVLSKTSSPVHCVQRAKIFSCMSNAGNGDM